MDVEVAKNRIAGSKPEFRLRIDFERASLGVIDCRPTAARLPPGTSLEPTARLPPRPWA